MLWKTNEMKTPSSEYSLLREVRINTIMGSTALSRYRAVHEYMYRRSFCLWVTQAVRFSGPVQRGECICRLVFGGLGDCRV